MNKLSHKQVARFAAIRAKMKAVNPVAANDNSNTRSAYVNTTMTPGMLAACIEAAGYAS